MIRHSSRAIDSRVVTTLASRLLAGMARRERHSAADAHCWPFGQRRDAATAACGHETMAQASHSTLSDRGACCDLCSLGHLVHHDQDAAPSQSTTDDMDNTIGLSCPLFNHEFHGLVRLEPATLIASPDLPVASHDATLASRRGAGVAIWANSISAASMLSGSPVSLATRTASSARSSGVIACRFRSACC